MVDFNLKIDGLKEFDDRLKKLNAKVATSILRSALNQASNPMLQDARNLAPVSKAIKKKHVYKKAGKFLSKSKDRQVINPGILKKSIRKSSKIDRKNIKSTSAVVKIRAGDANAYYVHMVHAGTKQRSTAKGANRGSVAPNPFLKKAFDKNYLSVIENFKNILKSKIENVSAGA